MAILVPSRTGMRLADAGVRPLERTNLLSLIPINGFGSGTVDASGFITDGPFVNLAMHLTRRHARMYAPASASATVGRTRAGGPQPMQPTGMGGGRGKGLLLGRSLPGRLAGPAGLLGRLPARWGRGRRGRAAPLEPPST